MRPIAWAQAGLRRLARGATTWPTAADWRLSAIVLAATSLAMVTLGFVTGLYHITHGRLGGLPLRAAIAFFTPALGEEAVFRGLLVPSRAEAPLPTLAIATAIFVLWHVVEALVLLPHARPLFLRPDFLACAGILGLGCAIVRWRSGSIWPGVFGHWLVVVAWQTWLGGPGLEQLR